MKKFDSSKLENKSLSSLISILLTHLTGGIYVYSRTKRKLIYHNEEFESITGVAALEFRKRGLAPYFEQMVPEDHQLVEWKIYPFIADFLIRKKDSSISMYKYSLNYRIKGPGKIRHLFHQTTILEHMPNNEPEVTLTHVSDISEYKKDIAMILVIFGYDTEKKKWKKLTDQKFFHTPKILSARETTIMQLLVAGLSQHLIAEKLHISYYTVRAHCRHILEKTGCRSIKDLRQKSLEEGWA